jgi:hypothetical protein
MLNDVSEITAIIVGAATRKVDDGPEGSALDGLSSLFLCAERYIGHAAEEVLWDSVSASLASRSIALPGGWEPIGHINAAGRYPMREINAVPIEVLVETYILKLGALIGLKLCLHHLKNCFVSVHGANG